MYSPIRQVLSPESSTDETNVLGKKDENRSIVFLSHCRADPTFSAVLSGVFPVFSLRFDQLQCYFEGKRPRLHGGTHVARDGGGSSAERVTCDENRSINKPINDFLRRVCSPWVIAASARRRCRVLINLLLNRGQKTQLFRADDFASEHAVQPSIR